MPPRIEPVGRMRNRVLALTPWWRGSRNKHHIQEAWSPVKIIGCWVGADGVVHGRALGGGKPREPYQRGVQSCCSKPWKLMPGPHGPAEPRGLRRVDFLRFDVRVTCESCVRSIDNMIAGKPPPCPDPDLEEAA